MTDEHPTPRPRLSRRTGEELPPPELRALARERSEARRVQDWEEADRLRGLIEAHGWKVIDKGTEGRVVRAHPEDVVEDDDVIRYGWTGAVPAYDGERTPGVATIVARATPDPDDTLRLVSRLIDAPPDTHLLLVVDDTAMLPADTRGAEIVRIQGTASPGVALAIAVLRARGATIMVGEGWPAEATADRIPALIGLLDDEAVGVAGWWGIATADLRNLLPADDSMGAPVAVAWAGMAFRTMDGQGRGPVDEEFHDAGMIAAWWSLVLRDEDDAPPRSARALLDAADAGLGTAERDRAGRRDRYRLFDRFGGRTDLLTDPIAVDRSRALRR